MSRCLACGRVEPFNRGQNVEGGWLCSSCRNLGTRGGNPDTAQTAPFENNQNIQMVGVLGNLQYSPGMATAIRSAYNAGNNGNDGVAESIWGLGFPANHHTMPHANNVVVFTRTGGQFKVFAIGHHTGSNDDYRIMRWTGSSYNAHR